jgi:hypothetical protein
MLVPHNTFPVHFILYSVIFFYFFIFFYLGETINGAYRKSQDENLTIGISDGIFNLSFINLSNADQIISFVGSGWGNTEINPYYGFNFLILFNYCGKFELIYLTLNITMGTVFPFMEYFIYLCNRLSFCLLSNLHVIIGTPSGGNIFIFSADGDVEIVQCVFEKSFRIVAPLVYCYTADYNSISVVNSTFQHLVGIVNEALLVAADSFKIYFSFSNSSCTNITSVSAFGGLFNIKFNDSSASFSVNNCSFNYISSTLNHGYGCVFGLLITDIYSFEFNNNELVSIESNMSGALFINNTLNSTEFFINDCIFSSCTSSSGGAIFFSGVFHFIYLFIYLFVIIIIIVILFLQFIFFILNDKNPIITRNSRFKANKALLEKEGNDIILVASSSFTTISLLTIYSNELSSCCSDSSSSRVVFYYSGSYDDLTHLLPNCEETSAEKEPAAPPISAVGVIVLAFIGVVILILVIVLIVLLAKYKKSRRVNRG